MEQKRLLSARPYLFFCFSFSACSSIIALILGLRRTFVFFSLLDFFDLFFLLSFLFLGRFAEFEEPAGTASVISESMLSVR